MAEIILPKGAQLIEEKKPSSNIVLPKGAELITDKKQQITEFTPAGRDKNGIPLVTINSENNETEIPFTKDVDNSQKVDFFGFKFVLPKGEEQKPAIYSGLLNTNAKKALTSFSFNTPLEQTRNEIETLKTASPDEISDFFKAKKQEVTDIYKTQQIQHPDIKNQDFMLQTIKNSNLGLEERSLINELDNNAKQIAFQNASFMYKNMNDFYSAPDDVILKSAQHIGNDIQNINDDAQRSLFKAKSDLNINGIGYSENYKENLTYLGLQSELSNIYSEIENDSNSLKEKVKEIDALSEQLKQTPQDKSLIEKINTLIKDEFEPLKNNLEFKEKFAKRLNYLSNELPGVKERIKYQEKVDKDFEKYTSSLTTDNPDLLGLVEYTAKPLFNRLGNTLLQTAIASNKAAEYYGWKNPEETKIIEAGLQNDNTWEAVVPKKLKETPVFEWKGDDKLPTINWNVALPMTLQTTAETLIMGGVAAPLATYGEAGQLAGLYLGSTAVFGGDLLKGELEKGLSYKDALGITALRLGVEAATEKLNPLEILPFNGIPKKGLLGKVFTKTDFIDYVGKNWNKVLPRIKAVSGDVTRVLLETGKQAGYESIEEILSDLGNYGIDKYVLDNIKPDYRQDNEFTVQNEINTALTTALTMLPMAGYGGYQKLKSDKRPETLRWNASQMPDTFLKNLKENFDKKNITKEFYETGVKEVETIKSIYQANKEKIDNTDEELRPEYLNLLYTQRQIVENISTEQDEKKRESLTKDLEEVTSKIQYFDKEASVPTVEKVEKKSEDIYVQNIKDISTEEELNKATEEELIKTKESLEKVVENPFSEKVANEAKNTIDKIDEKLAPEEELSLVDKELSKISTLSKEELENYNPLSFKELSKEDKRKLVNKKLERQQSFENEEKTVVLKDRDDNNKTSTFNDGDYVTYQGDTYRVRKNENNEGYLINEVTKAQKNNFSLSEIKPKPVKLQEETVVEEPVEFATGDQLTNVFGKPYEEETPTETPSNDIEAKKADIERRRREELFKETLNKVDKSFATDNNITSLNNENDKRDKPEGRSITGNRIQVFEVFIDKLSKAFPEKFEELKKLFLGERGKYYLPINSFTKIVNVLKKEGINSTLDIVKHLENYEQNKDKEINAKYDAELAELEQSTKEKIEISQPIQETVQVEQEVSNKKPINEEKVKKEQNKIIVEKYTEPATPFKNGKTKSSNWNKVLSEIKENISNYKVKVVNTNTLKFDELPYNTQQYFEKLALDNKSSVEEAMSKDKGKMLVVTNKEGQIEYFDGKPLVSNFPDGKLSLWKDSYELQGFTEKEYYDKLELIKEARKNNSTLLISKITNYPVEITEDKNLLSVAVQDNPFSIKKGSKGYPSAFLGEQEIPLISRKLSSDEIDSMLYILFDRWATSGSMTDKTSDKYQKAQFVQKLILTGLGSGKINFKGDPKARTWEITIKQPDGTFKNATREEVKSFLENSHININYSLLNENTPFTTYKIEDGKIVVNKEYKTYLDFLKDNIYTRGTSATKLQDNYYIEVGNIDSSLSAKIEEATTEPKEITSVETIQEKTPETINNPSLDEFKDILEMEDKDIKEVSEEDEFKGLLRNKTLGNKVTNEQANKAKEWFNNSPISKHISLKQFQNIVNSDAYATWLPSAITLWKGSEYTDLYHESWHEFSQLYLTPDQKKALYKEIKNLNIDIQDKNGKTIKSSKATDKEIEEHIGEDYRNYGLSNQTLILNNRPKRNSIFRKIYNFLKELITGNVDLQTYYERLYTGNISKYKRDLNNSFWGNLNSGITTKDGKQLSFTDTKNLYRAIDSLVGTIFQQNNKPVTMMFADNNVLNVIYSAIFKKFNTERIKLLKSVKERIANIASLSETERQQLSVDSQTIRNLTTILNDWNKVIAEHKKYSAFFNISKDKLTFDEDGNIVSIDDLYDEETDEGNDRNSELIKNENVSSKEAASNETIFTVATLPRYEADGTKAVNPFFPFVQDIVDFNSTWDNLTTITNNTLEYTQILDKIGELGKKNKSFENLLERLPNPNKVLTDEEQRLKASFINDISKPLVNVYELVFTPVDNGGVRVFYKSASSSDVDRVKNTWYDNFQQYSPFLVEQEDGSLFVDKTLLNDYKYNGSKPAFHYNQSDYNKADKQELFENRLDFLYNIGITFTDELLSDPEFQEFITTDFKKIGDYQYHSPVFSIFSLMSKSKDEISSLRDLTKKSFTPENTRFSYFSQSIDKLAEFELKFSKSLFAQSVKNAEQNNVWQIRQWSYITKVFNSLNDYNKYPTYDELQKEEWLQQFNIDVNPYVKGIFLNTLFDLNPNSPTYKQRRVIKKGKEIIYPTISLQDYNGIKLNTGNSVANEGKSTTSLTPFEKLVQNINSLLLFNTQENLRYGDKSSSYSTSISHLLNPTTGKLEEKNSIIPLTSFVADDKTTVVLPKEALGYLIADLKQELLPMINNIQNNIGANLKYYNKNIKNFGIFDSILSEDTKKQIRENILDKNLSEKEIEDVLKTLSLKADFEQYITAKTKELSTLLDSKGLLEDKEFLDPRLLKQGNTIIHKTALLNAYVVNSLLYNIEHTKIVSFDPRFYKNPKDVIKRLSAFSATGNLFVVDDQTNNYIYSKGMAIRDAVAKKLNVDIPNLFTDGSVQSVIFNDNEYSASNLFEQYKKIFLETGKFTSEQLDKILSAYNKINEPDGQGAITLDVLRESKLRAGSSHWTKEHEIAYQKEAKFISGESTEGMSVEEVITLFVPQKWQVAGSSIDKNGIPFPIFYKFSVVPLIPSMIKGTNYEDIHDNLVKQNSHLALFESGSKASAVLNVDGKFNPFYSDYATRTPYTGEYTTNKIFFQYIKEQVNTDPSLKGKSTFSTQMRKLLHLNLFSNGIPNDVNLSYEDWFKLSNTEKKSISPIYRSEQRFGDVIEKLIKIEQDTIIKKMGATLNSDGTYSLDAEKLQEFFKEEFIKRDLPNEVINYLQVSDGKFSFPLDAFKKRDTLERIAYSIANKRLVQQKATGEALVQVASTGFELKGKFSEVREDSDLPFYKQEYDKDGKPLPTSAQKIKIAFTSRWKPLLNLTYKGEKIKTLDRLNEAIKDEKWLTENRDSITIVGVRIPVQGLNSQEFMEVYHFLPETAGNVIVVSPALVAKSGGDFDIDKLTTFFPNLFENKYTGQVKLYKSSEIKYNDKEIGKKLKELSKPSEKKFKDLKQIRKNLYSEIDYIKQQKENTKVSRQEIKRNLRQLDVEIALLKQNKDFLEEVEFALQNSEDFSWISEKVMEIGGVEGLTEATESAIESTKQSINEKIQKADLDKIFLLKMINLSLDEYNQDLNYSFKEIKNINDIINPLKEYLGNMQEIVYQSSAKKAYENEIISIIRETLSRPDNFMQLVRPNDTDLLNNDEYGAGKLKELFSKNRDNTFTSVVDFASLLQEFESNLVGKANLSITAVNNVFFALAQRAGLYLNNNYQYTNFSGKVVKKPTEFYLPHNTVRIGNEEFISLSGLNSKNSENHISDIISQFINGFVDVAKDDWVFFINGVKEFIPTMLYTTMAGVNAKTNIAFFNQPIMKEYISQVQEYKNIFIKNKDNDAYNLGVWTALQDTVFIYATEKKEWQLPSDEELNKDYEDYIKSSQIEISFNKYKEQEKNKVFKVIFNDIKKTVNPLFLNEKTLSEALYENKPLSNEEQIFLLLHYYELKRQSGLVTNFQRSLNSDTKKLGSYYSIVERQDLFEKAKESGLFNIDAMNRMREESTIKAFTNSKTGFDSFVSNLYNELFEVVNHKTFNKDIQDIIKTDPELKFEYKFSKMDKFISTLKNDFITYLFQNHVLDENEPLVQKIKPLFLPKTSIAKDLKQIKTTYSNLSKEFPILDMLIPDNLKSDSGKILKVNLKLKSALRDKDELDNAVNQIRNLLAFNSSKYTPEEQIEIQKFTNKLVKFIIIQSGLNPSIFNLMDIIPNESYTNLIKERIKLVRDSFEKDKNKPINQKSLSEKPKSYQSIEKFYNKWKTQRFNYFNFKESEEGEIPTLNYKNERGLDLYISSSDITGEKEAKFEAKILEQAKKLPSMSNLVDRITIQNAKKEPSTLFITTEADGNVFAKQNLNNYSSISINSKEDVDKVIKDIIAKSIDFSKIAFQTKGYLQNEINSDVFNYFSQRVLDTFGIKNNNFEGEISQINEDVLPLPKTKEEVQLSKEQSEAIKGIEINSYQTGLGNDLTNVHYANNQYPKSKYPIIPSDKSLTLTQAAKSKWGESVEAWYKSNQAKTKGIPEGEKGDKYDFDLMVGLITDKLTQYPNLVQQINERGGLAFLEKSTHNMGTGRWSSKNPKNMFMSSLIQAYKNVSKEVQLTSTQTVEQIYSKLGNKTVSENVKIVNWNDIKLAPPILTKEINENSKLLNKIGDSISFPLFSGSGKITNISKNGNNYEITIEGRFGLHGKDKIVKANFIGNKFVDLTVNGESRKIDESKIFYLQNSLMFINNSSKIVSTRQNGGFANYSFGNLFSSDASITSKNASITPTKDTKEAVEKYIDWVINSNDKRAENIRQLLKSGELKGKPILYYKELGEPSHATALDYLINKYDWNKTSTQDKFSKKNVFTVKPIQSVDKKAIVKASVANKFIGFGEGITDSSTESYRQQILEQVNKTLTLEDVLKEYTIEQLKQGVSLKSLQNKIEEKDFETIKQAYNYLKSEEKYRSIKNSNESINFKLEQLRKRIKQTKATKVGSVLTITNAENLSDYKVKVLEINRYLDYAILKVKTSKNKEYTIRVNSDGSTKTGEIDDFVFEGSKESSENLIEEINNLKSQIQELKSDYSDYYIDYFDKTTNNNQIVNTENYNSNDVVFVSIPGKRGNEQVRKEQQDKTIREALKAIEAGATLITDNKSYVDNSDYNEGEKRLAKNLEAKGYQYSEITVDEQVLGIWNKISIQKSIENSNETPGCTSPF